MSHQTSYPHVEYENSIPMCPQCGGYQVDLTQRFMMSREGHPYRCKTCGWRGDEHPEFGEES